MRLLEGGWSESHVLCQGIMYHVGVVVIGLEDTMVAPAGPGSNTPGNHGGRNISGGDVNSGQEGQQIVNSTGSRAVGQWGRGGRRGTDIASGTGMGNYHMGGEPVMVV